VSGSQYPAPTRQVCEAKNTRHLLHLNPIARIAYRLEPIFPVADGLGPTGIDWQAICPSRVGQESSSTVSVWTASAEHHEGKAERFIPLFPELRPHLEAVWYEAPEGATHFITRYRDPAQNLRTTFQKIIHRAGLKPWLKLFQNLRSSRQTELEESYPSHVVCAWMGNSRAVAQKHYLQVTDEHFAIAAQNPAQSEHATDCTEPQEAMAAHEQTPVLPAVASGRDYLPLRPVGSTGFEVPSDSREKRDSSAARTVIVATESILANISAWLNGCPLNLTEEQKISILEILRKH